MKLLACAAVGAALLLGACSSTSGGSAAQAGEGSATGRSGPHAVTNSPAPRAPSSAASSPATAVGIARCGDAAGETPHSFRLSVGSSVLPAAVLGTGKNVAVLLHQTDGDGACGWFPVAGMMAAQGVRVLAFDLCGYGSARCPRSTTPARQVRAAVHWARTHGAGRVTVVGASMGGSVALGTADEVTPDAVIDLSGPMEWDGVTDSARAARRLRSPLLAAATAGDPSTDPAALRRAVQASPGTHRFVRSPSGHGIEMLTSYKNGTDLPTPLLRTVVRWVKGVYA